MAFEALGDHLGDLAPDSVCLKMAAKNFNGETVWASILPVLWNEIIAGGTELRLFSKSTPTIPPQATEFSKRIYIERPTVTIKISKSSAKDDHSRYVTILLPKSYNVGIFQNKLPCPFTEYGRWNTYLFFRKQGSKPLTS
jgi:hypothetical protein